MSGKRGFSHIEVILAFIIFIGFLIFALFFFNPLDTGRVLESSLFYAFDEVSDNLTIPMESYSVVIKNHVLSGILEIPLDPQTETDNLIVEYQNGNTLNADYEQGNVRFDLPVGGSENRFITIRFSKDFENDILSGIIQMLVDIDYDISSSEIKDVISEKRAIELETLYDTNYEQLKKDFNLPGRVDFAFSLVFDNDKIEAIRNIPEGLEVVVKEERVEVIRTSEEIVFADLNVNVW